MFSCAIGSTYGRNCVQLSIYHLSDASIKYMIYFSPLTFGLGKLILLFFPFRNIIRFPHPAHAHHAWGITIAMGVHG
jgi:hypothetical protein